MQGPMKTFAGRSRMSKEHVREGAIPAYFSWEDGSEYEVFRVDENTCLRRYTGPFFGVAKGDWKTERFEA